MLNVAAARRSNADFDPSVYEEGHTLAVQKVDVDGPTHKFELSKNERGV
jgi:hypothetical protein